MVKGYSEEIPEYLQQRPKTFIDHCMKRLSEADGEIEYIEEGFIVKNCSGATYRVSTSVPNCSCQDFQRNGLPCKHMLLEVKVKNTWESFPDHYVYSPLFTIDYDILHEDTTIDNDNFTESS